MTSAEGGDSRLQLRATGAKVGDWASGNEMAGAVGADAMDEVATEVTDEAEED